jgi:hypothetical protein
VLAPMIAAVKWMAKPILIMAMVPHKPRRYQPEYCRYIYASWLIAGSNKGKGKLHRLGIKGEWHPGSCIAVDAPRSLPARPYSTHCHPISH